MAKKNITKIIIGTDETVKPILIKDALINDDFCNYAYEIVSGVGTGDTVKRKGSAIIHEDMRTCLEKLNVHLAVIDDAFAYKGIEVKDIDKMHDHELTENFKVSGFKITGSAENESVVLIGSKWVSTGGSIGLETPKISLTGNYPFVDQLQEAVEAARNEVEQYMNGKMAPKFEQTEMEFATSDEDFSNASL